MKIVTNRVKAPNFAHLFLLTYQTNLEGVPCDLTFGGGGGGEETHISYAIPLHLHESEATVLNVFDSHSLCQIILYNY